MAAYQDALAGKPPIIATGDWVTTDANVELRPVAVAKTFLRATEPDGATRVSAWSRSGN